MIVAHCTAMKTDCLIEVPTSSQSVTGESVYLDFAKVFRILLVQDLPQQLTSTCFLFVGSTKDTENAFDDALAHLESICKVLDTNLYSDNHELHPSLL